jgi:hypothetical protein
VSAQSIDTVSSEFVDTELVSVSNGSAFEGGADEEDDEVYRQRLLDNVRADGFGTAGWYENLCEGVSGVHDVLLVSDASYTRKVLVNGMVKETPDTVLLDVLAALTDLDNHVLNHSFTVAKPTYTSTKLYVTLSVATELSEATLNGFMNTLFNGGSYGEFEADGLAINQVLNKSDIIGTLELFDDVISVDSVKYDVSGTATDFTSLSPASNGVLKLTSVVWTQNEVD